MSDQNINSQTAPYGAFLLRVSLGVMFIAHGLILKYFTFTLGGTAQYFESIGYPGFLAYAVFAAETLGGIALVLGFQTRLVAFGLVPVLIGAMLEHAGNGWVFSAEGGGWEQGERRARRCGGGVQATQRAAVAGGQGDGGCLLYTSPSPRD